MRKVKLSMGLHALVDDEDFERINQYKWTASKGSGNGQKWYAIRREKIDGKLRRVAMHRFLMGLDHLDSRVVDHLDNDSLDNRKGNLSICTQYENMLRSHAHRRKMKPRNDAKK